jgi:transposase
MEAVKRRRRRSKLERRQIVEETLKPGTSVAIVARAQGINANQLFQWRKLYREGRLEVEESSSALLPVKISNAIRKPTQRRESQTIKSGTIDIDLGHARVRIEGTVDPDCVRASVEGLLR